jgi:hypothetical protein
MLHVRYSDGETWCCLAIELAESRANFSRHNGTANETWGGMQPARPTRVTAQYRARLLLFCRTANGVTRGGRVHLQAN